MTLNTSHVAGDPNHPSEHNALATQVNQNTTDIAARETSAHAAATYETQAHASGTYLAMNAAAPTARLIAYDGLSAGGGNYAIGLAFSGDAGQSAVRYRKNPVLAASGGSNFDSNGVVDPCLVQRGDTLFMFYAGINTGGNFALGLALSYDGGVTWTRASTTQLVAYGTAGAFDDGNMRYPTVVYDSAAGKFRMWYLGGHTGAGINSGSIGYCESSSGLPGTWTRPSSSAVLSPQGAEGAYMPGTAAPINGTWYLWWAFFTDGTLNYADTAYATSPDATTWTRQGTILTHRQTAVQTLTANVSAAATSIPVTDSSVFNVGEPVYVYDSTNWEMARIQAIPDGTHVTLRSGLQKPYTTANTAKIVSLFQAKVQPRAYVREPDGHVLYLATWGEIPGQVREDTAAATSTNLTSWSYDNNRGALLPKPTATGDATSAWDAVSSENPSVIPASVVALTRKDVTGFYGATLVQSTSQAIASNGATWSTLPRDSAVNDSAFNGVSYANGSTVAWKVPPGASGVYEISFRVDWEGLNTTGYRNAAYYVNGTQINNMIVGNPSGTQACDCILSDTITLNDGDVVDIRVQQNSGVSLHVFFTRATLRKVG